MSTDMDVMQYFSLCSCVLTSPLLKLEDYKYDPVFQTRDGSLL